MGGRKVHYAWWILAAFFAVQGASMGMIQNCRGIFYLPVCNALGFNVGEFTLYTLLQSIGNCLSLPFVGVLLKKYDARIVLSSAAALLVASTASMAFFNSLYQWYIAGVAQGVASAFLMVVPGPLILGNWFYKKRGTAIGIASAAAGIIGVIMNPVGAAIIERYGWQAGYLVFAFLIAAITLPFTLFVVRYQPSEMGLKAYGQGDGEVQEPEQAEGVTAGRALRSASLWLMMLMSALVTVSSCAPQHYSGYANLLGLGAMLGATMVSFSMAGNIGGKLLLGALNDRFGAKSVSVLGILMVVTGQAAVFLFKNSFALFAGAALTGVAMSVFSVMLPAATREIFGARDYGKIYSYTAMSSTIASSLAIVVVGYIYDITGSYTSSFAAMPLITLASIGVLFAAYRFKPIWVKSEV